VNGPELKIVASGATVVEFPGVANYQVGNAMMASGLLAENGFITPTGMDLAVLVPREGVDGTDVLMMLTAVLEELAAG
jgi:hypothetical protein